MATPLRSLRSTLPSSSQFGRRLRREPSFLAAHGSVRCYFWSCQQAASRSGDRAIKHSAVAGQTEALGDGLLRTARSLDATTVALQPRLRCFSASAAPLFGDTIIVTKRCAERVNELRKAKSQPGLRLRLTVEGGGCSGFQYKFALEDPAAGGGPVGDGMNVADDEDSDDEDDADVDHEFERDGAVLVVDETSLGFVKGATVDFEENMMRSAFAVVNNPASESACGCGSSFAIKNFEKNPALD